jgi:hypothetical protein
MMFAQISKHLSWVVLSALIVCLSLQSVAAEDVVAVTEVSPGVIVFATSGGNVVASVGADGALLVGTPSASSTAQIADDLANRTKSAVRYVVIGPQDVAVSEGDAGWGRRGAFVVMHENALGRLGGHAMGPARPLPPHLIELGVDRPRVAFSEVITFDLNGEAIHVVHQPPGYSDADSIAHFHAAHLVYLGEVFPGDGYPEVDTHQGGKLDGLLNTLKGWTGSTMQVVPVHGKVASGADVKAFYDMIVSVRDDVKGMIGAGKSEQQVIEQHPTAKFDARWGNGRISSDAFVHEVYNTVKAAATPNAPPR